MKQVTYAGKSFVTGSNIADAVVRLTAALGLSHETATVSIPAVDENGHRTTADLVLGPATEVLAIAVLSDFDEIVDQAIVAALDERVRLLAPPRAVASSTDMPRVAHLGEFD